VCGDLEPEDRLESDLYQRFRVQAQAMLKRPRSGSGELNRYLDGLFNDLLKRCCDDADRSDEDPSGYARVAMQSLVLARLAGFLAGHVALQEDPMRKVLEAVMHGYREAESPPERDHHGPGGHDHGHHDHGHAHDHSHSHDHPHDHA
jgi:hypothetical protein